MSSISVRQQTREGKPSNIMLGSEDRVKVVDFGLATLTEPAASFDQTVDALTGAGGPLGSAPT